MAYINGIGIISPQPTAESKAFPAELRECTADFLSCVEPVYRTYIDPIQSRRMSRLIKMGISSAKMSIADAGLEMPDAIITGTGLGSVDDTEKILSEITREEKFLNPTPFIQSTYNTISSQVAIQLKCHNYNSTYVHRTFSFESGLIDALLQLEEKSAANVLVGAVDEMTLNHLHITRRIGQWRKEPVNNLSLLDSPVPGALAGEGSAFFTIGVSPAPSTYAELTDVATAINLDRSFSPEDFVLKFLQRNGLTPADVDILLLGVNGDSLHDPACTALAEKTLPSVATGWYKHLCGEYHTATGFGLYAAANMVKHQIFPEMFHLNGKSPASVGTILLYNHFRSVNHALMLVREPGPTGRQA